MKGFFNTTSKIIIYKRKLENFFDIGNWWRYKFAMTKYLIWAQRLFKPTNLYNFTNTDWCNKFASYNVSQSCRQPVWQDASIIFQYLTIYNIENLLSSITILLKVCSNFYAIQNIPQRLLKFCHSSKISLNLVTLPAALNQKMYYAKLIASI